MITATAAAADDDDDDDDAGDDDGGGGGGTDHLIADRGACVHDCPPGRRSNNSRCVECEGPCPKSKSTAYMQ